MGTCSHCLYPDSDKATEKWCFGDNQWNLKMAWLLNYTKELLLILLGVEWSSVYVNRNTYISKLHAEVCVVFFLSIFIGV